MSADGNERGGVKAPRTLFSLGRPGTRRPGPDSAEPIGGAVDTVETADAPAEVTDDNDIQYACGACGALLPGQASFCGECGTPVAMDDDLDDDDGMLDELAGLDDEPPASSTVDEPEPASVEAPLAVDAPETVAPVAVDEPVAVDAPETAPVPETEPEPSTPDAHRGWAAAGLAGAGAAVAADAVSHAPGEADAPVVDEAPQAADAPLVTEAWPPGPAATPVAPAATSDEPPPFTPPAYVPQGPIPPAATQVPDEPAAVLFADPSIAEPLPTEPMTSFTVSEPVHGTAAGAEPIDPDAPAAAGAAVGGAAIGAAGVGGAVVGGAMAGEAAAAGAPAAPPMAPAAPGTPQPATIADANFAGTTATSMPYGTGPVESSAARGRGPLIAAVVVVAILLVGAIAFALTRGGGSDVATQPSTTQAPITTAKAPAAKGSTSTTETPTTEAVESSTTTTIEDTTTTTELTTSSTVTPSTSATPATGGGSSNPTSPPVTTAGTAALTFQGPTDFGIISKGGSVSFTVTNVGNASGEFQCSANGLQLNPSAGTVAPNTTQQILVVDFQRREAAYSISCLGAGGSRFISKVTVGKN